MRAQLTDLAMASRDLEPLRRANAERQVEGNRLRKAIETVWGHLDRPATAKQILRELRVAEIGRAQLPSVRTVQWHLKAIRHNGSALRSKVSALRFAPR